MSLVLPLQIPLTRPLQHGLNSSGIGGPFDPLNLNPAVLLDGAEDVLNRLGAPTLDWNTAEPVGDPEVAAVFTGTTGGYLSVLDAAALDITGDITIQVDNVTLPDWTPSADSCLISKWLPAGDQRSYMLRIDTTGTVDLLVSFNGSTVTYYVSTEATGLAAGATASIRVTRTDDKIDFELDSGSGFNPLGTQVSGAATEFKVGTGNVELGAQNVGTSNLLTGAIGRARIWSDATRTTKVLDINIPVDADIGDSTFTATSGQTATVNGDAIIGAVNEASRVSATGPVVDVVRAGNMATYFDSAGMNRNAAQNELRIDYDPDTLVCRGALIEPEVAQEVKKTDFSSLWNDSNTSNIAGGGYKGQASRVVTATANNGNYRTTFTSLDGDPPDSVLYTGSFWARTVGTSTGANAMFHNSSVSGGLTVIDITSEWQFFEVSFLGRSGGGTVYFGIHVDIDEEVVEIAMPQVEVGSVATSFIPNTTGAARTRPADVVTIGPGDAFDNIWNDAAGTIYVEVVARDWGTSQVGVVSVNDGTANNGDIIFIDGTGDPDDIRTYSPNGLPTMSANVDAVPDTLFRVAYSMKSGNWGFAVDGTGVTNATVVAMPTVNRLSIGANAVDALQINGHIMRLIYWPYHSTDI